MPEGAIVRLQQITIENYKNIKHGSFNMPTFNSNYEFTSLKPDIIGIYGQNGSGKTAVIDALFLLQSLIKGKDLPENLYDQIHTESDTAKFQFAFSIQSDKEAEINDRGAIIDDRAIVFYSFSITKITKENIIEEKSSNNVFISNETIKVKDYVNTEWTDLKTLLELNNFEKNTNETINLRPQKLLDKIVSYKNITMNKLYIDNELSKEKGLSYIFSKKFREFFQQEDIKTRIKNKTLYDDTKYTDIILLYYSLTHITGFVMEDMFIVLNINNAFLNANLSIPFIFKIPDNLGTISIGLEKKTSISKRKFEVLKKIIKQMNIVLSSIIPNLMVDIKEMGIELDDNANEILAIELISVRGEIKIPLRNESAGILKIISILSALINIYNNRSFFLAIDELDSGIYEYLLGEILDIISNYGKGQMIFTSHNLRPLEVLESKSIVFTTTDSNDAYKKPTNIKRTNNLRDVYLRTIELGNDKIGYYNRTNSFEINRAFRKAGKCFDE